MADRRRPTDDNGKLLALRRVQRIATAMLALCVAVFLLARALSPRFPALAYLAAFAEAATIGGVADWYAVVALFRRPLGLPIPHTAIIPENRERIADNLGRFIELNFLAPAAVERKLKEVDFAAQVAEWLADRGRAESLAGFVATQIPRAADAFETSGLRDFAVERIVEQIGKIEIAPLAGELLGAFTEDRRHQILLDGLIKVLGRFLADEEAQGALRDRIRDELPSVFKVLRADAYLVKRILNSARGLLEDVHADPDHAMRHEFDRFVESFVAKLRTSPKYARRAEALKQDFMTRPAFRQGVAELWRNLRTRIEEDAAAPDSAVRRHLAGMFVSVGRQLAEDPLVRADMNEGFVVGFQSFIETQKSGVSGFIAEQVKGWDLTQMTRLIELNIGSDLQYIRFNGMLIGGMAGLLLYVSERLLHLTS